MSLIAITRFKADPADAAEVRARHAALVSAIRSTEKAGLSEARLGRLDEQTWVGVWRWDSREHLLAARQGAPNQPEATAAFAIVTDVTGEEIELTDVIDA